MASASPPPHDPNREEVRRGHQPDGVSVRRVVGAGVVLSLVVIAALVFLVWFQDYLLRTEPQAEIPTAWQREERPPTDFDQPAQLRALRAWEERTLSEYAWRDEERAAARIPVDRAMEILLEEGIPTGQAPDVEPRGEGAEDAKPNETKPEETPSADSSPDKQPAVTEEPADDAPADAPAEIPTDAPSEPPQSDGETANENESNE